MAAFSTMALLGLGALAGSFASRKIRSKDADSRVLAPAATPAPVTTPIPAPPSAPRAASDAMSQAQQAAQRQRRRARPAAGILAAPRRNPAARLQPRTLVGASTSVLGG